MDKESVGYIINHYSKWMQPEEREAWRHMHSYMKHDFNNPEVNLTSLEKLYKKVGWISEKESVLALLKDGPENFELRMATRIFNQHKDKIFMNNCPECGKLARTPLAKQCRHCGFDWH